MAVASAGQGALSGDCCHKSPTAELACQREAEPGRRRLGSGGSVRRSEGGGVGGKVANCFDLQEQARGVRYTEGREVLGEDQCTRSTCSSMVVFTCIS